MYHALCGPHGLVYITGKTVYQKSIQSVIMRFPSDIRDPRQIPNISMGRIPIFHRLYEGPLTINSIMSNVSPSDAIPSKFQSIPLWSKSTKYPLSTPHFPNFEWSHDYTPPNNYSPTTCCITWSCHRPSSHSNSQSITLQSNPFRYSDSAREITNDDRQHRYNCSNTARYIRQFCRLYLIIIPNLFIWGIQ